MTRGPWSSTTNCVRSTLHAFDTLNVSSGSVLSDTAYIWTTDSSISYFVLHAQNLQRNCDSLKILLSIAARVKSYGA